MVSSVANRTVTNRTCCSVVTSGDWNRPKTFFHLNIEWRFFTSGLLQRPLKRTLCTNGLSGIFLRDQVRPALKGRLLQCLDAVLVWVTGIGTAFLPALKVISEDLWCEHFTGRNPVPLPATQPKQRPSTEAIAQVDSVLVGGTAKNSRAFSNAKFS